MQQHSGKPEKPPGTQFKDSANIGRTFAVLIIISMASGLFGAVYASIFYADPARFHLMRGFFTGFSVAFLTAGFELFVVRAFKHRLARKLPFLLALIARIIVLTILIRVALIANDLLAWFVTGQDGPLVIGFQENFTDEVRDTLISFIIVVIAVVFAQLSSLIGIGRFINLLLGRYFHPVRENRAFLFVDLKNSTGLAVELGDVRFHEYLSRFFYEVDRAIVRTGGEVVSYVGDAVIVTWPLTQDRKKNARPLKALGEMIARLEEVKPAFIAGFGHSPEFRAALHGGPVVVGECGDSRRQITYLGEVVNTTARIESQTKSENIDFIASSAVIAQMDLPSTVAQSELGEFELKGLPAPISLARLSFA